jgi:hypothetical protein
MSWEAFSMELRAIIGMKPFKLYQLFDNGVHVKITESNYLEILDLSLANWQFTGYI